jgi:hypothetical protein
MSYETGQAKNEVGYFSIAVSAVLRERGRISLSTEEGRGSSQAEVKRNAITEQSLSTATLFRCPPGFGQFNQLSTCKVFLSFKFQENEKRERHIVELCNSS